MNFKYKNGFLILENEFLILEKKQYFLIFKIYVIILEIIFRKWIFKIRARISNIKKLFSNIENVYIFFLNIRNKFSNILEIHLQFFSSIKSFRFLSTMVWYFRKKKWFKDKQALNVVEECKSFRFIRNSVLEYVFIKVAIACSKTRAKMCTVVYKA